jgi:hypothetical protein
MIISALLLAGVAAASVPDLVAAEGDLVAAAARAFLSFRGPETHFCLSVQGSEPTPAVMRRRGSARTGYLPLSECTRPMSSPPPLVDVSALAWDQESRVSVAVERPTGSGSERCVYRFEWRHGRWLQRDANTCVIACR